MNDQSRRLAKFSKAALVQWRRERQAAIVAALETMTVREVAAALGVVHSEVIRWRDERIA